jgi:electron transport complex protein RnfD
MTVSEFWAGSPVFGTVSGLGWEWVNAGFLLGGLYLLWKRIITWHIPVGMLVAITVLSVAFYDSGSSASHGSPLFHLFAGASMLGAFFIATDPVSAATTPRGRLIYGLLIGALVYIIRVWGNYPDAVAFAVLLGNFAAPLIDYYTRPRTFGHKAK